MGYGIDKKSILFLVYEDRIVEHLNLLCRNEVIHKTFDEIDPDGRSYIPPGYRFLCTGSC